MSVSPREIYKTGWVKLVLGKRPMKLKNAQDLFLVFCVHDDRVPLLELYKDTEEVASHQPYKVFDLLQCSYVTGVVANDCAFSIGFEYDDREALQLIVLSPEEKNAWLQALQRKLMAMNCLQSGSNEYSALPANSPFEQSSTLNRRLQPASSASECCLSLSTSRSVQEDKSVANPEYLRDPFDTCLSSTSGSAAEPVTNADLNVKAYHVAKESALEPEIHEKPQLPPRESGVSPDLLVAPNGPTEEGPIPSENQLLLDGYDVLSTSLRSKLSPKALSVSLPTYENTCEVLVDRMRISHLPEGDISPPSLAEPLKVSVPSSCYYKEICKSPTPTTPTHLETSTTTTITTYSNTETKTPSDTENGVAASRSGETFEVRANLEAPVKNGSSTSEESHAEQSFQNYDAPIENVFCEKYKAVHADPARPPPLPPRNFARRLTPKERDVLELANEISEKTSIRLMLSPLYLTRIAFVEVFDFLWIAGWHEMQNGKTRLGSMFHVGDHLVSIEGEPMSSEHQLRSYLYTSSTRTSEVEVLIKRVPFGKVFLFKKNTADQENLGIIHKDGKNEIVQVTDGSVAAKSGLPPRTTSFFDRDTETNWFITEVNGRPVNLFAKDNECALRLSAIGKEISVLVQPADFIKCLKKRFKLLKHYKTYVVK